MIQEADPVSGSNEQNPVVTQNISGDRFEHPYKRLRLWLIKPSKYDDEGYVIRYWKGVIPSNTLNCLYGLSETVRESGVFGADLRWDIELIDDTVEKVDLRKIIKAKREKGTKTLVCLVGVQTNQFVRASHLAVTLRQHGVDVLIGGFHVSGILATLPEIPGDLKKLQDTGVVLVAGEAEGGRWEQILRDALKDDLQPVYNFLGVAPDISCAPLPRIHEKFVNRYAVHRFTALDCGRGCPFKCSFCTVINVQGRKMRFRDVEAVAGQIRENYRKHKIIFYFFTDDNFSRNKNWEALFEAFARLREEEKIPFRFMIQVDTKSHHVPDFVVKARRAGCSQVFIGMESLNDDNLKSVGKTQNDIEDFKRLVDLYQKNGIVAHLAYIIGFPFDTAESVRKDIKKLMELGAGQASFFMMTPLPGSMDYLATVQARTMLDADFNNYDSFHETHRHARMAPGEWVQAYEDAWKDFYSVENMQNALRNATPENYWGIFLNFVWYKNSVQVEKGHPMLHGFVRLKGRLERRPDYPLEGRWVYFKRRVRDVWNLLYGWFKLCLEMEELWLATRRRRPIEEKVVMELAHLSKWAKEWRTVRLAELQAMYRRAASHVSAESGGEVKTSIKIPSRFQLWLAKHNIFAVSPLTFSRRPRKRFWRRVNLDFRRGHIFQINYLRLLANGFSECIHLVRFLFSFLRRSLPFSHRDSHTVAR